LSLLLTVFRCFAHIVNLTAKAMLDQAANEGDDYNSVKKLRDAIVHVSLLSFFLISKLIL